jgi:hypothetical protein
MWDLTEADAAAQEAHFGVARDQIEHDFVISHVLNAIARHADRFVFYGGTALSRTILKGLRLSEDIDLLSIGPRHETAAILDQAIRDGLERNFGLIEARPWMSEARRDTDACIFRIRDVQLQVQLIEGTDYSPWPRQRSEVSLRYTGLESVQLTTYTPEGFAGAKTSAWCDTTRNAPRDLYDLWAMAEAGHITSRAAQTYKQFGPTGGYPRRWTFPSAPPSTDEWYDALGHQCIPAVGPNEAFDAVLAAWDTAVAEAERLSSF